MSRMQRRKPWYKKPAGICGIAAAVLVIVGLVLFFALRGSGQEEPAERLAATVSMCR